MKHFRFVLALLILISLISCLSIETEITLNNNESGTASLVYSVSTLAADINNIDRSDNVLPFPITKEDFDSAAEINSGVQIQSYDLSDDGSRYYINSEISFESFESLSEFTGTQFLIEDRGNNKVLTVIVYEFSSDEQISEQALNLVRDNFSEDSFIIRINIPGDIIRVQGATFSGSQVRFEINVEDLLQRNNSIQFSVEYR